MELITLLLEDGIGIDMWAEVSLTEEFTDCPTMSLEFKQALSIATLRYLEYNVVVNSYHPDYISLERYLLNHKTISILHNGDTKYVSIFECYVVGDYREEVTTVHLTLRST